MRFRRTTAGYFLIVSVKKISIQDIWDMCPQKLYQLLDYHIALYNIHYNLSAHVLVSTCKKIQGCPFKIGACDAVAPFSFVLARAPPVLRGHAQSGGRKKGWSLEIFYSRAITHFSKNLVSF